MMQPQRRRRQQQREADQSQDSAKGQWVEPVAAAASVADVITAPFPHPWLRPERDTTAAIAAVNNDSRSGNTNNEGKTEADLKPISGCRIQNILTGNFGEETMLANETPFALRYFLATKYRGVPCASCVFAGLHIVFPT